MEKLLKLADSLDQRGLKKEADMLDGILQEVGKTISAAEEAAEEEKSQRETSKKVMKMFKRLNEAAEKVSDGNVDTRGPYRPLFDKTRFLAEEIRTLLKDIKFTSEDEQKAAEDGRIEENLQQAEGGSELTGPVIETTPELEAPVVADPVANVLEEIVEPFTLKI